MTAANLREALRELHADALIRQAETIRDWPAGRERHEQAEIHVRFALWENTMGRISQATQSRVFSLLHIALPDAADFTDEATPLEVLEREAEWEQAYHEQLERQSCPECGDGACPVDETPR